MNQSMPATDGTRWAHAHLVTDPAYRGRFVVGPTRARSQASQSPRGAPKGRIPSLLARCPTSTAHRIPVSLGTGPTVDRGSCQVPSQRHGYEGPAHMRPERTNQKGSTRARRLRLSPSQANPARQRRAAQSPTVDRRQDRVATLPALRAVPQTEGIRTALGHLSAWRTKRGSRPYVRPSANSSTPVPRLWLSSRRPRPQSGRLVRSLPERQTHHWSLNRSLVDGPNPVEVQRLTPHPLNPGLSREGSR